MNNPRPETARKQIIHAIQEWIPDSPIEVIGTAEYRSIPLDDMSDSSHGIKLRVGTHRFNIHWKSASASTAILHAIHFLSREREDFIRIVAVPFMGPTGKKLCEREHINWMDLSGNAFIQAPGLRINQSGMPNKFVAKGRKASVFAPKSSRVIRWLLLNPKRNFSNKLLASETGVDPGHASRILERLVKSDYVSRSPSGAFTLSNPALLLGDWRDEYDFFKQNEVIRGHIPARSSEELVKDIAAHLSKGKMPQFAFTGLAAAWQYANWVTFRLVTIYLAEHPDSQLLSELRFTDEPRGSNTWFVVPKDEGVFMGTKNLSGLPCVSKIQAYLDLKDQPERSDEAAEELYRTLDLGKENA
jgi:hypothetical protein